MSETNLTEERGGKTTCFIKAFQRIKCNFGNIDQIFLVVQKNHYSTTPVEQKVLLKNAKLMIISTYTRQLVFEKAENANIL